MTDWQIGLLRRLCEIALIGLPLLYFFGPFVVSIWEDWKEGRQR